MKGLILATGSTGMVGSRFVELTKRKNFLHLPDEVELDITDPEAVKRIYSEYNFSAIINFAAYTSVAEAEKQRGQEDGDCWIINVEGVKNLVSVINPNKTHFIQISTDMVFPGSEEDPGPYSEDRLAETDENKLSWYGFTKAEAERIVLEKLGNKATILRLIYPVRAKFKDKLDYLRNVLKLYDEDKLYPMFTDQQVSISFVDEICVALDKIIVNNHYGVFHASTPNTASPYELYSYLLKKARGVEDVLEATSIDKFLEKVDNPARYPKFGGLKVEQTEKTLGIKFSTWQEIIDKLIEQGLS